MDYFPSRIPQSSSGEEGGSPPKAVPPVTPVTKNPNIPLKNNRRHQYPIGKTSRSTPATYLKVFTIQPVHTPTETKRSSGWTRGIERRSQRGFFLVTIVVNSW